MSITQRRPHGDRDGERKHTHSPKPIPTPAPPKPPPSKHPPLLHWNDLPSWQRDNHYIHTSYRPASSSYLTSLSSLTYLHNETVNIYTHLLGFLTIVLLSLPLYQSLSTRYPTATIADVYAFACFFIGAAACLGMSAAFHLTSNHSHAVAAFGNKLDYVGIVFLIAGSFVPSIFYGFQCHPILQIVYWGMISALGLTCATVSIHPQFRHPTYRSLRATLFITYGLSALIPVLHGLTLYGPHELNRRMGLTWVVLQGAVYIIGAAIYAARIPERLAPGRFDVWGASHQVFHLLVLGAAGVHLWGLLGAFDFWHGEGRGRC